MLSHCLYDKQATDTCRELLMVVEEMFANTVISGCLKEGKSIHFGEAVKCILWKIPPPKKNPSKKK